MNLVPLELCQSGRRNNCPTPLPFSRTCEVKEHITECLPTFRKYIVKGKFKQVKLNYE